MSDKRAAAKETGKQQRRRRHAGGKVKWALGSHNYMRFWQEHERWWTYFGAGTAKLRSILGEGEICGFRCMLLIEWRFGKKKITAEDEGGGCAENIKALICRLSAENSAKVARRFFFPLGWKDHWESFKKKTGMGKKDCNHLSLLILQRFPPKV